ncbi:MAG: hypothetical protein M1836_002540 [Candelina mexicana]|nr:MAG: hypothetical protein M1836_002540 [Candelina mexicana]
MTPTPKSPTKSASGVRHHAMITRSKSGSSGVASLLSSSARSSLWLIGGKRIRIRVGPKKPEISSRVWINCRFRMQDGKIFRVVRGGAFVLDPRDGALSSPQ